MNPPSHCLECHAPLSAADAGGLCPKCLLRLGLASQLASGTLPATAPGLTPEGAVLEPFEFGGYRILRLLGKGGMGAVYEAEQRATGRRVALKVLGQTLDTPEMRQRFLREGQLAAAVRHPNSVAVFSTEEIEGAPVIAMELVPDGTLKDRVKSAGPLPIAEAVDAVLQIIDGLEAAHAGGVLHRDIKPANCFFGPGDTVKVGDFGLSISTLVKAEQQLTQTGAVLGTPAFASPEQLRAQEIDVRSDIYSVGATLYYLLTGQPTHDAATLVALIAAVLERDPLDPRKLRPEIPVGLARAVMRCLARNAAARFPSYAELRAALLPFRSAAPQPAPLSLRTFAGIIDAMVLTLPWVVAITLTGIDFETSVLVHRTAGAWLGFGMVLLWEALVWALPEGRWGASLGKSLCGLRVVRMNGDHPGYGRALGRWTILALATYGHLPLLLALHSREECQQAWLGSGFFWEDALPVILCIGLFVTMRRGNGFAAIHDLLTGTRVVLAPDSSNAAPEPMPPSAPVPISGQSLGPFAVGERLSPTLTIATDQALRRRVWILDSPKGGPAAPPARRDLARSSRLRWLLGMRTAEESWDAFEAPEGAPLVRYLDGAQPWARVRRWLSDLADELRAGLDDGTLPAEVGIDRLWLTRAGRAVLLDFPAPGAPPLPVSAITDQRGAQGFLSSIAAAAVGPRLPGHARDFLETLAAGRFESMALAAGNLRADAEKPAEVSFRRRLLSVATPIVLALGVAVTGFFVTRHDAARFDAQWADRYPGRVSPREFTEVHDDSSSLPVRAACLTLLAGKYRDVVDDETFWGRPGLALSSAEPIRALLRAASTALPQVSAGELRAAEQRVRPRLREHRKFQRHSALLLPLGFSVAVLAGGGFLAVICAALFGAPPLLRLNDLVLVNARGEPASRLRIIIRTVLGWSPMFIGFGAVAIGWDGDTQRFQGALLVVAGCVLLALAGAVWSVCRRTRAPHDHLVGTWLVPR